MKWFALCLIVLVLGLSACSTDTADTAVNTTNDTQNATVALDIDTDSMDADAQSDALVLGDANNNTFAVWENDSEENESVDSLVDEPESEDEPLLVTSSEPTFTITGLATRAGGDRYTINRILIRTDAEVDETTFLEITQDGNFALYDYDSELDCDSIVAIFKSRNIFYGTKIVDGQTELCFAPPRDMYDYYDLNIVMKNAYGEQLLSQTVTSPRLIRSTQVVELYKGNGE